VTVTETTTTATTPSAAAQGNSAPEDVTPAADPDTVVVADMIGQNYQDAQDVWRASGLVVTPADDATGANRLPFIDSNWYVVDQTPPGGTEVPNGSNVKATVKKYSDN